MTTASEFSATIPATSIPAPRTGLEHEETGAVGSTAAAGSSDPGTDAWTEPAPRTARPVYWDVAEARWGPGVPRPF